MKEILNIDAFFTENVFEEEFVISYTYSPEKSEFSILFNKPEIPLDEKMYYQLIFKGVNDFSFEEGENSKLSSIDPFLKNDNSPPIQIAELNVGYGERSNKLGFTLCLGENFDDLGEIQFNFKTLFLKEYSKKETQIKSNTSRTDNQQSEFPANNKHQSPPYKTYQGKDYTREEWEAYEKKAVGGTQQE